MKFRPPFELIEVLTNPHKWRLTTLLSTIGLLGTLGNLGYVAATSKLPPRLIWNLFPVITLTGCAMEIAQQIGGKPDA
jgi:putative effector of murein hydrolase